MFIGIYTSPRVQPYNYYVANHPPTPSTTLPPLCFPQTAFGKSYNLAALSSTSAVYRSGTCTMSGFTSMNRVDERPANSTPHSSSTQSSIDPHLTPTQKPGLDTDRRTTQNGSLDTTTTTTTQKPTTTVASSISTPAIDPMLDPQFAGLDKSSDTKPEQQQQQQTSDTNSATHTTTATTRSDTKPSPQTQSVSPSNSSSSSVPQKRPNDEPAHTPTKVARVDQRNGTPNHNNSHAHHHHHHNNNVAFVYNDQQPPQSPQPPQPTQGQPQQPPHNPFLYPQSRSRANPPLDMGTVDSRATTRQQFESGDKSIRNDKFKLEHIPTVYPTMEDFQNRPKYMEMLHKYYGKYGMVKIVPPERWNIPFRLDTEVSMREGEN